MALALALSPRADARSRRARTSWWGPLRTPSILGWMTIAIGIVAALAFWDEERESTAALEDFAEEQATLARSVGAGIAEKIGRLDRDARPESLPREAGTIEKPGAIRVLLAPPWSADLVGTDGVRVTSTTLRAAVDGGARSARLSRPEASALGLPARMALAGLSAVEGPSGRWTVLVVATAKEERDREVRARWRLVLGVVVASGLVLAFGGLALRKQRKELQLAHELALSTLRTERDERLVLADKLATMGALATGIAHEVSTPLGVILGRAEQLLPRQPDERSRRAVESISTQIERIHVVIRGFLALARGGQPSLEHCAPEELARAAIELVEHRFEEASVALRTDVAGTMPKVACEPRLFEQVLVNLLLNACDACTVGGVVTLRVRPHDDRVSFAVLDDGVGIAPEVAERVTEPFFTTKPQGKGTGLGLAIASEIVKHHMGSLTLGAREGSRGTCASVELPARHG